MTASFISPAWIFLPRYSGVRPTIRPAMNTLRMARISLPYRPAPAPPGLTSPEQDVHERHRAAQGRVALVRRVVASPAEVAVMALPSSAELPTPKRVSLPSRLPPTLAAVAAWDTPALASLGLPGALEARR